MADPAVKFPSARQDVFYIDPQSNSPVFTRPWFLFFQALWQRQGGAVAPSVPDIEGSLFEDAGGSETQALLFSLQQSLGQDPLFQQDIGRVAPQQDTGQDPAFQFMVEQQSTLLALQAQLDETRDKVAELTKTIDDIKQGVLL